MIWNIVVYELIKYIKLIVCIQFNCICYIKLIIINIYQVYIHYL